MAKNNEGRAESTKKGFGRRKYVKECVPFGFVHVRMCGPGVYSYSKEKLKAIASYFWLGVVIYPWAECVLDTTV